MQNEFITRFSCFLKNLSLAKRVISDQRKDFVYWIGIFFGDFVGNSWVNSLINQSSFEGGFCFSVLYCSLCNQTQ